MSDDQDGCEWVNVSFRHWATGPPWQSWTKGIKWLYVFVKLNVFLFVNDCMICALIAVAFLSNYFDLLRLQCFDAVGWAAGRPSGL